MQNEFLCKKYIFFNALDDSHHIFQTSKQLWKSLEKKYNSEVASVKMFIVGKFLHFKMSDIVSVVKQVGKKKSKSLLMKDMRLAVNSWDYS